MSDIYNKNAREKALLEEAYTNIYNEEHPAQRAAESIVGAEVMWDGMMKRGQVEEVDLENGVAVVYDEDGGEHIVPLGDFDVVLPVEDAEGALGNLVKGVGRGIGDVAKGAGRVGAAVGGAGAVVAGGALGAAMNIARTLTADQLKKLGEYALEISADAEDGEFAVDLPDGTNLKFDYDDGKKKRLGSTRPARTASERRLATAEGDYMVGRGDPRVKRPERTQFAISGDEEEPGAAEKEDNIEYAKRHRDHSKGVKMAIEALEMFKDELHIDGHPEDINVNEVADAHEQLVRALNIIFDDTDVDYITGGRDRQFGEEAQRAHFDAMRDYEEHGN